ncbi:hypothetical protein Misp01_68030 [Microtetraspora sp. NBRC 13810]|nr:hypothetical protein Misp01_68030 [Microtetraspora sp. NBRC 13810]
MLSRRTIRGPVTACFHTPVCTVFPCQDTSFGIPTFTDSNLAMVILAPGGRYLISARKRRSDARTRDSPPSSPVSRR